MSLDEDKLERKFPEITYGQSQKILKVIKLFTYQQCIDDDDDPNMVCGLFYSMFAFTT